MISIAITAYRNQGVICTLRHLDVYGFQSTFCCVVLSQAITQFPRVYPDRWIRPRIVSNSSFEHIDSDAVLFEAAAIAIERLLDDQAQEPPKALRTSKG